MPVDTSSYADPTGNRLLAAASNDPNAALQTAANAQQIGLNAQVAQLRAAQISQSQLDFAKDKLGAMNTVLGGIVANPSMDNAQQRISDAVAAGVIDAPTAKAGLAQLMQTGGDPSSIKGWATDHLNQNANHQQLMDQAYGAPGTVNTGGSVVPVITRTGAQAGTTVGGGAPIANTLAPDSKTRRIDSVDPSTGGGVSSSVGQLYDERGNFRSIPVTRGGAPQGGGQDPAAAGQGGGQPPQAAPISFGGSAPATAPQGGQGGTATPTPQTIPVVTDGQARAALANVNAGKGTAADRNAVRGWAVQHNQPLDKLGDFEPQGAPAAPVSTAAPATPPLATGATARTDGMAVKPGSDANYLVRVAPSPDSPFAASAPSPASAGAGGVLTTSLSPGQQASITAGANSYGALSSDVASPQGVQQRTVQLRTALNALRGTNTGLGTAGRQQLVGYLASLPGGIGKYLPGIDPDSASDYDIASKYLNAYSLNTPGAARSDAGLSTAQSANANTSGMMKSAAVDVTLQNIGMENGKRALLNAFDASGADPGTFGKFAAGWSQNTDPRAFALGDMTPQERAKLYSGLQGPAKAAFLSTVKKGISAGVLTPADIQGAASNAN